MVNCYRPLMSYAFLALSLVLLQSSNVKAVRTTTIAHSVVQPPAAPEGVEFAAFGFAVLNNAGQIALMGFQSDDSGTGDSSIWLWESSELKLVAQEGELATEFSPNASIFSLDTSFALNDQGQVLYWADAIGPNIDTKNNSALWLYGNGHAELAVREVEIPNHNGQVAFPFSHYSINNLGSIAFQNDRRIFLSSRTGLRRLAGVGDSVPNGTGSQPLTQLSFNTAGNTDAGVGVFVGLISSAAGEPPISGLWRGDLDNLNLVVKRGDDAPGTSTRFGSFGWPSTNRFGHVAFRASTSSASSQGIWAEGSEGLRLVARLRDPAPGSTPRLSFYSFGHPMINDQGDTAFSAVLQAGNTNFTNDDSIWQTLNGELSLVAREGDPAPGTHAGERFALQPSRPVLNNAGQVAFLTTLTDDLAANDLGTGIWATDLEGTLNLIVRTGDLVEIAPNDFREVDYLQFLAEDRTRLLTTNYHGFNDTGHLAFTARFTDGSFGVFLAKTRGIPEPSSGLLLSIVLLACSQRSLLRDTSGCSV